MSEPSMKSIEDLLRDREVRHIVSEPAATPQGDTQRLLDRIQSNIQDAIKFHSTLEKCVPTPLVDLGLLKNIGQVSKFTEFVILYSLITVTFGAV